MRVEDVLAAEGVFEANALLQFDETLRDCFLGRNTASEQRAELSLKPHALALSVVLVGVEFNDVRNVRIGVARDYPAEGVVEGLGGRGFVEATLYRGRHLHAHNVELNADPLAVRPSAKKDAEERDDRPARLRRRQFGVVLVVADVDRQVS